ncbi:hypothetical protein COV58_01390 [Candidatus Roizmanbacteria bacterium CG11_big_fil_rev_8_21_14_0_20_36_8]|uniref:Uncharacterized protein n=1 Tax=Candidatus Roizmanbacteria bacterium CG11_big_fil_rev_8_21_14_0_20_36_8 TaxID=1974856 RepID=A0A2M6IUN7_9BACT|nr:MAG: hypothetical protein COV58_01390 [Candidatus Roizmanbacteria bacterium CG11_big_fil_rev_8_21_14_0_20_36_8]
MDASESHSPIAQADNSQEKKSFLTCLKDSLLLVKDRIFSSTPIPELVTAETNPVIGDVPVEFTTAAYKLELQPVEKARLLRMGKTAALGHDIWMKKRGEIYWAQVSQSPNSIVELAVAKTRLETTWTPSKWTLSRNTMDAEQVEVKVTETDLAGKERQVTYNIRPVDISNILGVLTRPHYVNDSVQWSSSHEPIDFESVEIGDPVQQFVRQAVRKKVEALGSDEDKLQQKIGVREDQNTVSAQRVLNRKNKPSTSWNPVLIGSKNGDTFEIIGGIRNVISTAKQLHPDRPDVEATKKYLELAGYQQTWIQSLTSVRE